MAQNGLHIKAFLFFNSVKDARQEREASVIHKNYVHTLDKLNKNILDPAIEETPSNPEHGINVARLCSRFVMQSIPDDAQESARANSIRQYVALEYFLTLVRQPGKYLFHMQKQFGPYLDPRNYGGGDTFNTSIGSLKRRLLAEKQGFNTQEERDFCLKRRQLLTVVEKTYNHLRDLALEHILPDQENDLDR